MMTVWPSFLEASPWAAGFFGSGTSASMSLVPETFSRTLPCTSTSSPRTETVVNFGVYPFSWRSCQSCGTDTTFPGFSFTVAKPLFKLTSTESTPLTFFNATSTTWAQVIQSMPKIDRSTCSNSARPGSAATMSAQARSKSLFRICIFLSKEIGKVDGEAVTLSRVERPRISIDRELYPGFDSNCAIHAEQAGTEKHLL